MSGLMSEIVTCVLGSWFTFVAWSRMRKAMSPVPPAMSKTFQPAWGAPGVWLPGFKLRTKWSFQRRWIPRDMKSFIVSYEEATELKTAPTVALID
ncbi:hypothetical protein KCU59_g9, partial [Aureobasidium melanogenum]